MNQIFSQKSNIIKSDCPMSQENSSGIKEIGIIQVLLQNNILKENSFLIIDEPEASLHPQWEIKFAEILVLLAKELNIHIYLNSHSPMFIEAISLYSQYYDLLNETNFYLTQKQDNGKYNFKKINPKNMGEVYENLTSPYDELDKLKAKILFKE
ncbi:AAA family ATPase [uncultured Methanobrevibacter sp.]|uniref:AAA family ATPase n=1 Tax=uncultured Methanobrevibacter sp. TaxID=253161 RepID=UPI0025F33258|nr:AAA family ATPase [uncultured Methanobrevibacter sp.]